MNDEILEYSPTEQLPKLALRGITVFPDMAVSFDVERKSSVAVLETVLQTQDRRVFVVGQRDVLGEYPEDEELYPVGVICVVRQFLRAQSGAMRVMVEGIDRAVIVSEVTSGAVSWVNVQAKRHGVARPGLKYEALNRTAVTLYGEYLQLIGTASPESMVSLAVRSDLGFTADYIAQNVTFTYEQKQHILGIFEPAKRLNAVLDMLRHEIDVLEVEDDINQKLRNQLAGTQRENILREHMRVIQAELGEDDFQEAEEYRRRILNTHLPKDDEEKLLREVERLVRQPYGSAEGSVIRNYLDAVLDLPWHKSTKERLDLAAVRKILDRDHYGLEKVKERILEALAVRCMAPDNKGGIICLVGPPGVGKTSIAISIAGAMNRKLARMSLGGVHDEADIRGHRKTYIGAMPGRIMTAVTQAGTNNPLLLLDEIDKLGSDYRGDPASALLEALDPEQNTSFRDHYLEIPFDLSSVMFITTANTTDTIPRPLLDRMEVIELTSYTDEEKVHIAREHLLPKQRKKHGLNAKTLRVSDPVIRDIISGYTRESGVRQLERELAALCRKADMLIASGEATYLTVTSSKLEDLLGVRRFKPERLSGLNRVGVVNGLAWTQVGGEMLEVECAVLEGTGKIELTGNLGNVMKESAQAAVSYIRSRCALLGIDKDFYRNRDIHLHFPEGAVPKDGPSAGITIACALISALTGVPARCDVAMTGEITVTGRVLAIGGLKEKTMAALRFGVKTVIIPEENLPDLEEIDQTVRRSLSFVTARRLDDILDTALVFPKGERGTVTEPAPAPVKPKTRVSQPGLRQ